MKLILCALPLLMASGTLAQESPLPIIDMHMHAKGAADFGPPPRTLCIPVTLHGIVDPQCPDPILSPLSDEAMIKQTVQILERAILGAR